MGDLRSLLKAPWALLDKHGDEVLRLVREMDLEEDARREAASEAARTERKVATQARRAQDAAAKAAARSQPQWAQTVRPYAGAMGPSSVLNAPIGATPPRFVWAAVPPVTPPSCPQKSDFVSPPSIGATPYTSPPSGYGFAPFVYAPYQYHASSPRLGSLPDTSRPHETP